MGEKAGHPFRGNQYGSGKGGKGGGSVGKGHEFMKGASSAKAHTMSSEARKETVRTAGLGEYTEAERRALVARAKARATGNFQPKDVGATGARIVITPTGKREVVTDKATENALKKAEKLLTRQNSMAGSGNKADITPDLISRVAKGRKAQADLLRSDRKEARAKGKDDMGFAYTKVGRMKRKEFEKGLRDAAKGAPGTLPSGTLSFGSSPSYESRIRAAGRGSANRAGNWSRGYGNK